MTNKTGLMIAQVVLVLTCVVFALMSACGGYFLAQSVLDGGAYGIWIIAGPFCVICGGVAFGLGFLTRKLQRQRSASDKAYALKPQSPQEEEHP
jgi:hypothetical protein